MRLVDSDNLKRQIMDVYEYEFPTASGTFDEFVTRIIPNVINNAEAVDALPVVRGEWINRGDYVTAAYGSLNVKQCSVCKKDITIDDFDSYCPNCGAKMD